MANEKLMAVVRKQGVAENRNGKSSEGQTADEMLSHQGEDHGT